MTRHRSPRHVPPRARSWDWQRVLIVGIAIIGVGVLLYPTAAAWFSDRIHATEISGYAETIEGLSQDEQAALLDQARRYNDELPAGPLRDPYTLNEQGQKEAVGSGSEAYRDTLAVDDSGVLGRISIPAIDADLPIFHGTEEDVLSKGVGHLFGSSLPVGGEGAHSVLTAHSGFVNATLFSRLNQLALEDVFTVTVLDETLYYRVDRIETVLPEQTEELRQVDGHDYLTLITCTPTGVNTHRLLVRGERIAAPGSDGSGAQTLAANAADPGFPWWALIFVTSATAAVLLTRPRRPRPAAGEATP